MDANLTDIETNTGTTDLFDPKDLADAPLTEAEDALVDVEDPYDAIGAADMAEESYYVEARVLKGSKKGGSCKKLKKSQIARGETNDLACAIKLKQKAIKGEELKSQCKSLKKSQIENGETLSPECVTYKLCKPLGQS